MEEISEQSKIKLRERQTELTRLIEALAKLDQSEEWNVVRELVFDKSVNVVERQLLNESLAVTIDTAKVYKLQGEWAWSKQFGDLKRFIENLKKELSYIKNQLHE